MILYKDPLRIELEEYVLLVNGTFHPPAIRHARDMYDVLADRYCLPDPQQELYYMFRDVYRQETLRYDITLIPPIRYGKEYAKTYGHYHPPATDGQGYPEVYQVLGGEAVFLYQKKNPDESVSVQIVKGAAGDVVLIPPDYGHVSANIGSGPLICGNVVSSGFESDYREYRKNRGAAVYYTTEGVVQNTSYLIRDIGHAQAQDINRQYGFACQDLLQEFHANPKKFGFLEKPGLMFGKE